METGLSYNDIKKILRKTDKIQYKFEILQYISQSFKENGENTEGQELLLRVLDRKDEFEDYKEVLKSLIRQYGLYPYLKNFELSLSDELVCEIHKPEGLDNIVFHRLQNEIYYTLLHKGNVVLSAPTSFGKSLIIDSIISSNIYANIMIIVPSIALIDETRKRLIRYQNKQYRVISFPGQFLGKKNIFVLTQERALDYIDKIDIDFFVIDEFYKLNIQDGQDENDSREIVLNQVFYKLFKSNAHYYLLGPNIERLIAKRLKEEDFRFIKTDFKTVVSEYHYLTASAQNKDKRLVELCKKLSGQTLIYCQSPASANKVAYILHEKLVGKRIVQNIPFVEWITENYHPDWNYPKYIEYGIGVHHGRIPRALAQKSVELFNQGLLHYLICTSTLIEGVNTKARNVIIYDDVVNRKKMDFFSFNNICGRSGRMNSYMIGNIYTFYERPQPELPFVNISVLDDEPTHIPDNLLINMDEEDLNVESRQKISKYKEQGVLTQELLRKHSYIRLDYLIELGQYLTDLPMSNLKKMIWKGEPKYDEVKTACELIWKYIVKSNRKISTISSGSQLCYKINQFARCKKISDYLKTIVNVEKKAVDKNSEIESALDFMRQWLNYKFPRYLMTLQDVVNEILDTRNLPHCDYSHYASYVESYFQQSYVIPFDECGLPIQISVKIRKFIQGDNVDSAIRSLKGLNVAKIPISYLKKKMIEDVQRSL